jgi:hypothetical protein
VYIELKFIQFISPDSWRTETPKLILIELNWM